MPAEGLLGGSPGQTTLPTEGQEELDGRQSRDLTVLKVMVWINDVYGSTQLGVQRLTWMLGRSTCGTLFLLQLGNDKHNCRSYLQFYLTFCSDRFSVP